MKTIILICVMLLQSLSAITQSSYVRPLAFSPQLPAVRATEPGEVELYSPITIQKKLRQSRRCIISGAVFTGLGGTIFLGGCGYLIWQIRRPPPVVQPGHVNGHEEDPTAIILWICAIPELAVGIPVVTIGAVQQKKWMKIKQQIDIHAGIMTDSQIGLVMNF